MPIGSPPRTSKVISLAATLPALSVAVTSSRFTPSGSRSASNVYWPLAVQGPGEHVAASCVAGPPLILAAMDLIPELAVGAFPSVASRVMVWGAALTSRAWDQPPAVRLTGGAAST